MGVGYSRSHWILKSRMSQELLNIVLDSRTDAKEGIILREFETYHETTKDNFIILKDAADVSDCDLSFSG